MLPILFVEICSEMSSRMFSQTNVFVPLFGYLQFAPECHKILTTTLNRVVRNNVEELTTRSRFERVIVE